MINKNGSCPYCGYILSLENSDFTPDNKDSDSYTKKMLLKYHFEASSECVKKFVEDLQYNGQIDRFFDENLEELFCNFDYAKYQAKWTPEGYELQ